MKKILLAATAAICAGGVASAQGVTLSGEGKLGLSYSKADTAGAQAETATIATANVKFTLSGETDNEMIGEFGASFTLDADEGSTVTQNEDGTYKSTLSNPFTVYVGSADGPFGKLTAGSDLGASDKKSGGLADPGLAGINVDDIAEAYYGKSEKTLAYEKSVAGATVGISVDLDDAWAIGGEYAISDQLTIGAGYDQKEVARAVATEGFNEQNTVSFGMIGSLNQFSAGFLYSSRSTAVPTGEAAVADTAAYGVEVGYEIGATKFTAIYAQNDEGTVANPDSGWGVGMSHDLGGGLSIKGAFGNVKDVTVANIGFLMAF